MRELDASSVEKIKTLQEFDDHFTAPLHGFKNAIDYYQRCSSIHFLSTISIPTLIVNAANDPFLNEECFPMQLDNPFVNFLRTERGGHVGFASFNKKNEYWSEQRALNFILHGI
jgi:hypothetical protein